MSDTDCCPTCGSTDPKVRLGRKWNSTAGAYARLFSFHCPDPFHDTTDTRPEEDAVSEDCRDCIHEFDDCPECCPDCWCADCTRRENRSDCSLGMMCDRFQRGEEAPHA